MTPLMKQTILKQFDIVTPLLTQNWFTKIPDSDAINQYESLPNNHDSDALKKAEDDSNSSRISRL